jgi:hypothetical protein
MDNNLISSLVSRFGSAVWDQYQVVRWMFYDYVRVPTGGTSQLQFFRVPAGALDPNVTGAQKTTEQTNVPKSTSFGQNYFALSAIRTHVNLLPKNRQSAAIAGSTRAVNRGYSGIAAGTMQTVYNFLNQGTLEIGFGDKQYLTLERPFTNVPPGAGVEISNIAGNYPAADVATGPNKYTALWVQQSIDPRNIFVVSPTLVIEPEQTINVAINFYGANSSAFTNTFIVDDTPTYSTPNIEVGMVFDGYLIRPRQ